MTPDDIQTLIDRMPELEVNDLLRQMRTITKAEANDLTRAVYGDEVANLEALFALEQS